MELTPLSPAPLPCWLFGLGSVLAGLTTLALATPVPAHCGYRLGRPPIPVRVAPPLGAAFLPGPSPACKTTAAPDWLRCQSAACVIDKNRMYKDPANLNTLFTHQVRIVPAVREGHPVGLKVYAIPPCSRAAMIGLRNGDLITRVNGRSVSTPSSVLQTYSQLRAASYFKVDLERSGRNVTFEYTLR